MDLGWIEIGEGSWLARLYEWITAPLFTVGNAPFSAANLLKLLLFFVVIAWVARGLRRILLRRVFPKTHVDPGTAQALSTVAFYGVVAIGTLVGLQVSGINLSTLTVLFGALGVGVGFGLQTIAANFISGLIILFEQPIRIGDRIQIGDLHGRVVRIRARATEVVTNDNIAVIVPNSEFIARQVINWSHGDDRIRIRVPVGVAYGSDPEEVRRALLEAAAAVDAVLREPPPKVRLKGFGESAIQFELLGWTTELLHARGEFVSRVNFAIYETLKRHGIEIPFPQRELRVRSPLPLKLVEAASSIVDGNPEVS